MTDLDIDLALTVSQVSIVGLSKQIILRTVWPRRFGKEITTG
jgi:hypothetical protein